jgi:hypothetical protein
MSTDQYISLDLELVLHKENDFIIKGLEYLSTEQKVTNVLKGALGGFGKQK